MTAAPGLAAPRTDIRLTIRAGLAAILLLVAGLGGWAATTAIEGAIITQGRITVPGQSRLVQHQDGGIVAALHVEEGDRVEAGQLLLSLDPTLVALNLDIARSRLAGALALRDRLEAEMQGRTPNFVSAPDPDSGVRLRADDLAAERDRQAEIFAARRDLLAGDQARLVETLGQIDQQISGLRAEVEALQAQIAILDDSIATQQRLTEDGLSRQSRLDDLQRQRAESDGRRIALETEMTRLEIAKREARMETEQSERGFLEEVVTELRDVQGRIEELMLEVATRQETLDRLDLRAPLDGVVHELQVSTAGAVIAPGATLLEIVPRDGRIEFEVEVAPTAIDQVYPGQEADVVFSAFDRQSVPKLRGEVHRISAAVLQDPRTGRGFYRVTLAVEAQELERLGAVDLVPGMPIEAYLGTAERTVLSYLLGPVTNHLRHAFRD